MDKEELTKIIQDILNKNAIKLGCEIVCKGEFQGCENCREIAKDIIKNI